MTITIADHSRSNFENALISLLMRDADKIKVLRKGLVNTLCSSPALGAWRTLPDHQMLGSSPMQSERYT